jgi:2-amino-4-hydroxy-6-hydroxymethyldihydropteridine diphosphokinase
MPLPTLEPAALPSIPIGLGLGSNLGDRAANVELALRELEERGIAHITARSSLWRTPPWGNVEQADFANLCALAQTHLSPPSLLAAIKGIEKALGRTEGIRWGPRVIDIDILFYDDLRSDDAALTLPHRELFRRAFVLVPLAEIAPDLVIAGRRIADTAREIDRAGIDKWD